MIHEDLFVIGMYFFDEFFSSVSQCTTIWEFCQGDEKNGSDDFGCVGFPFLGCVKGYYSADFSTLTNIIKRWHQGYKGLYKVMRLR